MDQQNQQTNPQPRDQNVLSFMMQLVQEKHGDDIDMSFLNEESDKLYNEFGDKLVSFFEPQLSPEQKKKFDELISSGSAQDQMLSFLLESIPTLEEQIMDVLVKFREEYIASAQTNQQ